MFDVVLIDYEIYGVTAMDSGGQQQQEEALRPASNSSSNHSAVCSLETSASTIGELYPEGGARGT